MAWAFSEPYITLLCMIIYIYIYIYISDPDTPTPDLSSLGSG